MKKYDVIFIGWGKASKTLAKQMALNNKKVAMVEQDPKMAGGTCINIACIPTKVLSVQSKKGDSFDDAMKRRDVVVEKLNGANYQNLASEDHVDIIFGQASFKNNYELMVSVDNDQLEISAPQIFINTGSLPIWPDIPNIKECDFVYDSTMIQELENQPQSLAIIGAGPIGLEFANIYQKLGSKVTLFEANSEILRNEEPEIRQEVMKIFNDQGIKIIFDSNILGINCDESQVHLRFNVDQVKSFDAVLIATGRKPAISSLKLENTDIQLNERNGIKTNEYLETNVPNIFALGDVRGKEQFTYMSLDDSRIINGHHTLLNRQNIPYSIFIDPVLSRVGLTLAQAQEQGYSTKVNMIPVSKMPRSHVNQDQRGLFKAVINLANNQILGASLLGEGSEEIINIIKLAMDHQIPAEALANQIFTHPTMSENLNDLFQ